jgi:hypothetical protein
VIGVLLFLVFMVWFIVQFYGARAEKWRRRGRSLAPVWRVVSNDLKVLVGALRMRREIAKMRRDLKKMP